MRITEGMESEMRGQCGKIRFRINETILSERTIRQLFTEGLQQIGLGDFRPEKGGPFGTAQIVEWQVMTERPAKESQKRNGKHVAVEAVL